MWLVNSAMQYLEESDLASIINNYIRREQRRIDEESRLAPIEYANLKPVKARRMNAMNFSRNNIGDVRN